MPKPKAEIDNTSRGHNSSSYDAKTESNNCYIMHLCIFYSARQKCRGFISDNCKVPSFTHHLKEAEIKITHTFGGRCLNIRYVSMDLEQCFKVLNLVSVYPKSIKVGQMTTFNVIFYVVVSDYRWLNFETCPNSLRNFGMAYN